MDIATFNTFWKADERGCHIWQGSKIVRGYGRLQVAGYTVLAHRHSYTLNVGPIPPGISVCHKCDNPSCVNPEHLFLGSAKDNADDMMAKGRGKHGLVHPVGTHPRENGGRARTVVLTPEAIRRLNAARTYTRRATSYIIDALILEHLPEVPEDGDK